MLDLLAPAAAAWGVLMAVSPVLQMRRMLDRHSSADVSLGYLIVLEVGFVLWIAYALSVGDLVILLPNGTALFFGAATIAVAWRYRARPGRP